MILGESPSRLGRWVPAWQLKVALLPAMGGSVTELKTPLVDERALDKLTLATDAPSSRTGNNV